MEKNETNKKANGKNQKVSEKPENKKKTTYRILNRNDLEIDFEQIVKENLDIAVSIQKINRETLEAISSEYTLRLKRKIRQKIKENGKEYVISLFSSKDNTKKFCREIFLDFYQETGNNSMINSESKLTTESNNHNIQILENAERAWQDYIVKYLGETDLGKSIQKKFNYKNNVNNDLDNKDNQIINNNEIMEGNNMSKKARNSRNKNKKGSRVIPLNSRDMKKELSEFIKMDKEIIERCLEENEEVIEDTEELIQEVYEAVKESCEEVKEVIDIEEVKEVINDNKEIKEFNNHSNNNVKGENEVLEDNKENLIVEENNIKEEEVKSNVRDVNEMFTKDELNKMSEDLLKDLLKPEEDKEEKKNGKHTKSLFGLISHGIKSTFTFVKDRVMDVVHYVENKVTNCFRRIKNLFSKKEKVETVSC